MRAGPAACLLLAVALSTSSAAADPAARPIADALDVGAATCLTRPAIAAQLASWLGKPELDARLAVTLRERPDAASFTVVRDGATVGERTLALSGRSCEEKRAAVGLALAVAIDATLLASLGLGPPPPPLAPTPPLAPAPPLAGRTQAPGVTSPPAPTPPPPSPPRRTPPQPSASHGGEGDPLVVRVDVDVEGDALVNVLPSVALAVAPAVDVSIGRVFSVRGGGLATGSVTVPLASGQAEARFAGARLDACLGRSTSSLRFRGCVGALGGPVVTAGTGYARTFTTSSPMVDAVLRLEGRWLLTPWFGLNLGLEGFLPATRPRLEVLDADGEVAASRGLPPAGFGVAFGPSVKIW